LFYYDDEIAVVELGTGDTLLMGSHLAGDDSVGTLSIIDNCGKCSPIGLKIDETKWKSIFESTKYDTDLNTVVRIVFRKVESVDSLIAELQDVKKWMEEHRGGGGKTSLVVVGFTGTHPLGGREGTTPKAATT